MRPRACPASDSAGQDAPPGLPAAAPCLLGLDSDAKECSAPRCIAGSAAWPINSTPSGPTAVAPRALQTSPRPRLRHCLNPGAPAERESADRPPIVLQESPPIFLRAAGRQSLDKGQVRLWETHVRPPAGIIDVQDAAGRISRFRAGRTWACPSTIVSRGPKCNWRPQLRRASQGPPPTLSDNKPRPTNGPFSLPND